MNLTLVFLLSASAFAVSNSEIQSRRRSFDGEEVEAERLPLPDISAHSRQRRQSTQCFNNTDCVPPSLSNVPIPTDLISCQSGDCVCRQCFERNSNNNTCRELAPCQTYNNVTLSCDDERRSQLVAMLLSLFLSEVGAANFYIARNDLAGGQFAIFLISILVLCFTSCPSCFLCCCSDDGEDSSTIGCCLYVLALVIGIVVAVSCAFIILAWWIADLVIFVQNTRLDGQNCMLRSDL